MEDNTRPISSPHPGCRCNAPDVRELCEGCRQIDFHRIFSQEVPQQPARICDLRHIMESDCTLCEFFRRSCLLRSRWSENGTPAFGLRLGSASPDFGSHMLQPTPTLRLFNREEPLFTTSGNLPLIILPVGGMCGISGRHIQRDAIDHGMVAAWLDLCDQQHGEECTGRNDTPDIQGMQVIDCRERGVIPMPRNIRYVTLSYVWGQTSDVDPTPAPRTSLPPQLPRTIEDAILVTQRLGFRYLWVDRYCIPQHDEVSRSIQIRSMGSIYANSSLTIIAAAGKDPNHGLPGVSLRPRAQQLSVRVGRHCLVTHLWPSDDVDASRWNTRGWTYQEALLAKRRLVFTDKQVYFQCWEMCCAEGITAPLRELRLGAPFPHHPAGSQPYIWNRIREFLHRDLSVDGDALDAMGGIFELHRELQGQPLDLLCGLPILPMQDTFLGVGARTASLAFALLWRDSPALTRRPGFPSWTWAGWKRDTRQAFRRFHVGSGGAVSPPVPRFFDTVIQVEVGDGRCLEWESHSSDLLRWPVPPRVLNISCWAFSARLTYSTQRGRPGYPAAGWTYVSPPSLAGRPVDMPEVRFVQREGASAMVLCLILSRYFTFGRLTIGFVILQRREDGSCFERLSSEWVEIEGLWDCDDHENGKAGTIDLEWERVRLG